MVGLSKEIIWRAAEYEYRRKDVGWYWTLGGVSAALVTIALWQKNFFFALFVVLAGIMLLFFGKRRPQVFEFRINEEGIGIGANIFYKYDQFENFAVHNRPRRLDEIVLKKKTMVNPFLKLPIDSSSAVGARKVLLEKLPEVEYQESLIEIISDWLGL